jgi:hypothetical protein
MDARMILPVDIRRERIQRKLIIIFQRLATWIPNWISHLMLLLACCTGLMIRRTVMWFGSTQLPIQDMFPQSVTLPERKVPYDIERIFTDSLPFADWVFPDARSVPEA